jgi:hypothetical protein
MFFLSKSKITQYNTRKGVVTDGSSHFEIDFAIVDRVTFGEILFQQISQQVHFEILKFV